MVKPLFGTNNGGDMYTQERPAFNQKLSTQLDILQVDLEQANSPLLRRWLRLRKRIYERRVPVLAALDAVHSYVGLCPVCGVDLGYPDGPDSEALCEPCRGAWL
jgi:hypothetical protein